MPEVCFLFLEKELKKQVDGTKDCGQSGPASTLSKSAAGPQSALVPPYPSGLCRPKSQQALGRRCKRNPAKHAHAFLLHSAQPAQRHSNDHLLARPLCVTREEMHAHAKSTRRRNKPAPADTVRSSQKTFSPPHGLLLSSISLRTATRRPGDPSEQEQSAPQKW